MMSSVLLLLCRPGRFSGQAFAYYLVLPLSWFFIVLARLWFHSTALYCRFHSFNQSSVVRFTIAWGGGGGGGRHLTWFRSSNRCF
jgi:hypothetical protein